MMCHRWNVDRTYDVTPQRDLQFYRSKLDVMLEPAVTWELYTDTFVQSLPPICTAGAHIWRDCTPIICMENVKMNVSDRVL